MKMLLDTNKRITTIAILGTLIFTFMSCDELIDIDPPADQIVRENIFQDDRTAESAIANIYIDLNSIGSFASGWSNSLTVLEGVYADELISYASQASSITPFYFNSVDPQTNTVGSYWSSSYNMIYSANAIIEGLRNSDGLTPSLKDQLLGEALFLRAFIHFYLVNLYGDVPYISTTDYEANAKVIRMPVDQVYENIIEDLLEAKTYLVDNYPSTQRVRANKGAATALLARAYLYAGDGENAEAQASEIIENTLQYSLLSDLNGVFLANSAEAVWQLIPQFGYTNEGSIFIFRAPPDQVALRNEVVNAFEPDDLRKENWVDSLVSTSGLTKWHFPFKYKEKSNNATGAEYSMVLRLAEQYLIRSEARVQQGKLTGANSAESDINIIRARAGLPNTTASTKEQLLTAIEQERRTELFTEWGHRFFDLKRWGKLDEVLDPLKPNWDSTDALLPIPQSEILSNPNLTQNPGY